MTQPSILDNASLTLALALTAGILCQAIARHLSVPSILLLLLVGVALGPDFANVIRPETLGEGLSGIVSFAVAVILFEGGLHLNLQRLKREQKPLRRLILSGPIVVTLGGALAAHYLLGFSWTLSILFGTLVIVTGPTVVNPLLKRMNVLHRVRAILEAEGVLSDALGAIVAVVALDVAIAPSARSAALGIFEVIKSLGFGLLFGGICGYLLALLLIPRRLVPEQLRNVVVLCAVFAIFHLADATVHESGIAAATMAGAVVGNMKTQGSFHLLEFKEQLTMMLIGLLFVLLSADVRIADVQTLGWGGVWVVLALALMVRPIHTGLSTMGSMLYSNERWFLAAIAPRGIVAAAVASLFANRLAEAGIDGGQELRALVFLVIGITVVQAAVLGPILSVALKVRRPANKGWFILGADPLGLTVARALRAAGVDALLVDLNEQACERAKAEGLRCLQGNAMQNDTLLAAEIDIRQGIIAAARVDAVNLLFLQRARRITDVEPLLASLTPKRAKANTEILRELHGHILFGQPVDHGLWVQRLDQGNVHLQRWQAGKNAFGIQSEIPDELVLFVAMRRKRVLEPISEASRIRQGTLVWLLIAPDRLAEARQFLKDRGFEALGPDKASKVPLPTHD